MSDVDEIRARVAASRAAQGLPPVVVDPAAIERAAAVLRDVTPSKTKAGAPTPATADTPTGASTDEPERTRAA